jgi:hypothetical protein
MLFAEPGGTSGGLHGAVPQHTRRSTWAIRQSPYNRVPKCRSAAVQGAVALGVGHHDEQAVPAHLAVMVGRASCLQFVPDDGQLQIAPLS